MGFTNEEINVDDLPKVENVTYRSLDNRYHSLIIIERIIFIFFIGIVMTGFLLWNPLFEQPIFKYLLVSFVIVFSGISLWTGFKSWHYKGYALREKDVFYKTGIWFRRNTIMAFHRVQHVEIHQGPLERLFGIASLTLFTAGGGSSDLTIPGLHPDTASAIKTQILKTSGIDEEE